MSHASLATEFQAYSLWRGDLIDRIGAYRQWLNREDLNDSQRDLRLHQVLNRLAEDKLHVAFIAEFFARQVGTHQRDFPIGPEAAPAAVERRPHDDVPDRTAL
jgi:hypothetical protein